MILWILKKVYFEWLVANIDINIRSKSWFTQIQVNLEASGAHLTVEEKILFNLNDSKIYVNGYDVTQFVINGEWELLGNFLLERIFANFINTK